MNIALFGGTFDPVHRGHLAVAHAVMADPRFQLERVYFVPADWPPHKQQNTVTPYLHRYAMLELALRDEAWFSVSEVEACTPGKSEPNYSIDTVRRFKQTLGPEDLLYFIVGADSFKSISTWRQPEALLLETRVVVVNRPGVDMAKAMNSVPEGAHVDHIYFVESVAEDISSTQIRNAAAADKKSLEHLVDPAVAEYIRRHRLYV
jgi:nicotinate-nucleotide adenylyltransferase